MAEDKESQLPTEQEIKETVVRLYQVATRVIKGEIQEGDKEFLQGTHGLFIKLGSEIISANLLRRSFEELAQEEGFFDKDEARFQRAREEWRASKKTPADFNRYIGERFLAAPSEASGLAHNALMRIRKAEVSRLGK